MPETFIATKPIFINGVLHKPGDTVTVYPVVNTEEAQRAADFSDGLVKPEDFNVSLIQPAPVAFTEKFVGAAAAAKTAPADAPVDTSIVVEQDAKPRSTRSKSVIED